MPLQQQLADYNICTPAQGMNARRMFDALVQKRGVALKPKLEIIWLYPKGMYIRNAIKRLMEML